MYRLLCRAFMLGVISLVSLGFSSAHATSQLYKRECNGCHSGPPTCNGCHAHGVHNVTGDPLALNLSAKTDKLDYTAGDEISVTLAGGNQPLPENGWVGVKLFDEKGVELGHSKTEFPATLTTRAYAGMTTLYVAWIGHEYDAAGAKYGTPMGDTFGVGMRDSFLAGVHLQERHIEEIVTTNTFTVSTTPQSLSTNSNATIEGQNGSASSSGGGSFDPLWLLGAIGIGLRTLRRRRRHNKTFNV